MEQDNVLRGCNALMKGNNEMKNKMFMIQMIFMLTTIFAENPIIQTRYTADPAPMVYNNRVYLYTSHDDDVTENGFFTMRDWMCYSSYDMVNWTDHGIVASLKDFKWIGNLNNGAWAPQCVHRDGKFYLYGPIQGKGIGVLVSDRPEGPFKDPINKPLINKNGYDDIDPTAFIDSDGQAYLYWGNPKLWYVKLNEDMVSYSGDVVTVPFSDASFGKRSVADSKRPCTYEEGPWIYKRDDLYYMVFAGGPLPEHIGYSMSTGPTGPWTYKGIIMTSQSGFAFTNHAGICDFMGNSYIFYHNQGLPGGDGYKRSVCVEQFTYKNDGSIPSITATKKGPDQVGSFNPYDTIEAETMWRESGIKTDVCSEGGMMVTQISDGDYISLKGVDFGTGASNFQIRAACGSAGGTIELRLGSQNGTLAGTCNISSTGGWNTWKTFDCVVTNCTGKNDLYLVFKGSGELFRLNWYLFTGEAGKRLTIQTIGQGTVTASPSGHNFAENILVTLTAEPLEGWEFKHWGGGKDSTKNPVEFTMINDTNVTAYFGRKANNDGNMILNGDFSKEADQWTFNTWSGKATGSVVNGEYRFTIDSVANNSYDIQLVQSGLYLENGNTYQVSFDAYSASDRTLEVNVEMAEDPWKSYLPQIQIFNTTTTNKNYSFKFVMNDMTDANGRLGFNAGSTVESVYIDNVSVTKVDPTQSRSYIRLKQKSNVKISCSNSILRTELVPQNHGTAFICVYNLNGKNMVNGSLKTRAGEVCIHNLNLSAFPGGYYIVKLTDEKRVNHFSKILHIK